MKIINFHEHVSDDLMERNRKLGIDVSVLQSVGSGDEEKGIALAEKHRGHFIVFAWLGDLSDIPEQVDRFSTLLENNLVKGVKFQPLIQYFFPEEKRLYPVYDFCEQRAVPLLFHCGIVTFYEEFGIPHLARYGNPVLGIDEIAYKFPKLPLVIAHMGGNYFYEACAVAEKHENISLDTAYLSFFCDRFIPRTTPSELIRHAVRLVGPLKLLYGWEGTDPSIILDAGIADRSKELIMHENAERLLYR